MESRQRTEQKGIAMDCEERLKMTKTKPRVAWASLKLIMYPRITKNYLELLILYLPTTPYRTLRCWCLDTRLLASQPVKNRLL